MYVAGRWMASMELSLLACWIVVWATSSLITWVDGFVKLLLACWIMSCSTGLLYAGGFVYIQCIYFC